MSRKAKILIRILIPILALILAFGWQEWNLSQPHLESSENAVVENLPISTLSPVDLGTPEPTSEPTPKPFQEYDITLMALGDNLMHMGIVYSGKQEDGSFDYSLLFEGISDLMGAADIRVINQETILGGNKLGFSGYPRFNSPTEVGDAIADAGFNVVLHATNHAADQGISGIENCISFWQSNHPDVLMVGILDDAEANTEIPLLEIQDKTFAILNYTYGTNSETLDKSLYGHVNMLCTYDESSGLIDFKTLNEKVITDIKAAKEIADVVIVFPHWGNEYQEEPSYYQEEFAKQMTEAGADLIIGAHPHVPQRVDWIDTDNGRALCYYSLGNYVSTQKTARSMLEEMAWVTFHVTEDSIEINEDKTGVIPLVCHYTSSPVRLKQVYLLEEYTDELARNHGIWNYGGVALTLEYLQQTSEEVFGDWIKYKSDVLGTSD